LRDAGFEVVTMSAPGPWSPGLEAEGIRHIPWRSATRAWNPRADARAFVELLQVLRRERFDLVHTHTPKPGLLGRLAARLAGVPCVVNTVHGLYAMPGDPRKRRLPVMALERLGARLSDLELYQSAEDLAWARRIGVVPPSRSMQLGSGVDLEWFRPGAVSAERRAEVRNELGVPDDAVLVATVARIVAEKGYRELFRAAAEIRTARDDVRFVAVGEIDRDKADAIGDEEVERARAHVAFTGWREDVRELIAAADVFALPSWREGMPRSAIEAAAMGKPLVLTDIRGCREVARDGVEGILVPARDSRRLAEAIVTLVEDAGLRERLGSAARERALRRFDERRLVELVIDEYRRLLAEKGRARRPKGPLRIRRARPVDAGALARLHRDALPGAFLPTLGDRFLTRLYRALADDPQAVALVAEENGDLLGFAAGVVSARSFSRRFYRRHGALALAGALPGLVRSGAARRVLETARHTAGNSGLPDPELVSIAVAASARRRGVGRTLAGAVVAGLGELGADEMKVVVGADNAAGNGLYARLGFSRDARIALHDGVPSNVWLAPCSG
jgi:glycosyltransferase involved in cell wall biosynthesis/ribosomal protein S18 acetylase RimI-like enzyme